jgi:hypothetical protein
VAGRGRQLSASSFRLERPDSNFPRFFRQHQGPKAGRRAEQEGGRPSRHGRYQRTGQGHDVFLFMVGMSGGYMFVVSPKLLFLLPLFHSAVRFLLVFRLIKFFQLDLASSYPFVYKFCAPCFRKSVWNWTCLCQLLLNPIVQN